MKVVEKKNEWQEKTEEIDNILKNYKDDSSSLIEVLHKVQNLVGYLPKELQKKVANSLNTVPGDVSSVISFYSHFSEFPKGEYQIAICKGTACYVKGSQKIIEKIEDKYGISAGESTEDGKLSLEVVRCLGACGLAPVMTINGRAHGLLNPEKAVGIIEKYLNGEM
ncbi:MULTISPECIES: NAD(P)H-dependent oxidoreductase subunit E [unclassified Halanaerobium]|uniref:NADH-quinone oxidoreductase subunit NuoE family protein n=1 Tax=unclassified Halanaerobium TaxID=2641197 RepID=UPI000DF3EAD9|nr:MULTISPECIES: NAD(P)H-dependent oxidoreductase subunit E [unclassified Halanaerobium]RCW48806.1 NADP-reducing hydrogenase subunit HndA [Halanaerobium sp. MA284_MarDTE_T2]RCW89148.1 NADP-reducing hydrogenase subunit HndA [Halanaerobium sp. DL-01]